MNIFEDYMTPIDRKEEAAAVAAILGTLTPNCKGASEDNDCVKMPSLAMVYSPKQVWKDIYEPDVALCHGTLFSDLYFPLEREKGRGGK